MTLDPNNLGTLLTWRRSWKSNRRLHRPSTLPTLTWRFDQPLWARSRVDEDELMVGDYVYYWKPQTHKLDPFRVAWTRDGGVRGSLN